jgi:hypothetical protein
MTLTGTKAGSSRMMVRRSSPSSKPMIVLRAAMRCLTIQ